jgi:hypothetical protein
MHLSLSPDQSIGSHDEAIREAMAPIRREWEAA